MQQILQEVARLDADVPSDLKEILPKGKRHPNDRPLGPLKTRGATSGIVARLTSGQYREIARYGDCERTEVTFSVSKSYLSALAGIAWRNGLITDVDEPVRNKVDDGGFESPHNRNITWRHLLQQTSEWEGELFGLPDAIDRGRQVSGDAGSTVGGSADGVRGLMAPGKFWEYNDVRVNRLSLCLLRLFQEPLPAVLKREVMGPIGASDSWQWHGYETSWVDVAGRQVQSVSGGAHWGGGIWINSQDHVRFGALYASGGTWEGREIIPKQWIEMSKQPALLNEGYGFLWWLNHDAALSTIASPSAFAARGAGGHEIFIWPDEQLVIVLRWCADAKRAVDLILTELGY